MKLCCSLVSHCLYSVFSHENSVSSGMKNCQWRSLSHENFTFLRKKYFPKTTKCTFNTSPCHFTMGSVASLSVFLHTSAAHWIMCVTALGCFPSVLLSENVSLCSVAVPGPLRARLSPAVAERGAALSQRLQHILSCSRPTWRRSTGQPPGSQHTTAKPRPGGEWGAPSPLANYLSFFFSWKRRKGLTAGGPCKMVSWIISRIVVWVRGWAVVVFKR